MVNLQQRVGQPGKIKIKLLLTRDQKLAKNELYLKTEIADDGPGMEIEQLIKITRVLEDKEESSTDVELNISTAKILAAA